MKKRDKLLAEWFWTDRWMGSSGFLLPIEPRGLYREMLTQAWRRGARLPNDHAAIRVACGVSPGEWRRCWPKVQRFWRADGDSLVNDTQLEIYAEAKALAQENHDRARAGATARWARKHSPSNAQASAPASAQALLEECAPSPSPSPERTNERSSVEAVRESQPPDGNGALTEAQIGQYGAAVWNAFLAKSGQPETRPMDSAAWSLVRRWIEQGVHLRWVLTGIAETKGTGRRLSYYGPSVEQEAQRCRQALGPDT